MSDADPLVAALEEWIDVFMHSSMQHLIQYARKEGLSMSQLGTLFHLDKMGTSGVTDLGDHLGVTSAAASQMLERLVDEGLIQRLEDPDDRRMKKITLTEKGSRVLKESVSARLGWLEELTEKLTEKEKKQITSAMELIILKAKEINVPGKGDCKPKES